MKNKTMVAAVLVAMVCGVLSYSIVSRYIARTPSAQPSPGPGAVIETWAEAVPPAVDAATGRVYAIEGMHCQSCADFIKQRLEAEGVTSATVSFEEKKAVVVLDPAKPLTDDQIVEVVAAAGYKATPEGTDSGQ